MKAALIKHEN